MLEVLKAPQGLEVSRELEFVQHGHGVADFPANEEVLVFLRHLSKSRELRALAETGELQWVSSQEHDESYILEKPSREPILSATRAYVSVDSLPSAKRSQALGRLSVKLLGSDEPRLARSALWDLVAAGDALPISRDQTTRALRVVHDSNAEIGVRVGTLVELERRELVDSATHLEKLLRSTTGTDRLSVIAASGSQSSPEVQAALVQILADADPMEASAAAVALGTPANAAAIEPLAVALGTRDDRVAMAAIRALGSIATPEARVALDDAAQNHPSERVRRRAAAESRLIGRR